MVKLNFSIVDVRMKNKRPNYYWFKENSTVMMNSSRIWNGYAMFDIITLSLIISSFVIQGDSRVESVDS